MQTSYLMETMKTPIRIFRWASDGPEQSGRILHLNARQHSVCFANHPLRHPPPITFSPKPLNLCIRSPTSRD